MIKILSALVLAMVTAVSAHAAAATGVYGAVAAYDPVHFRDRDGRLRIPICTALYNSVCFVCIRAFQVGQCRMKSGRQEVNRIFMRVTYSLSVLKFRASSWGWEECAIGELCAEYEEAAIADAWPSLFFVGFYFGRCYCYSVAC